jgi:3-deoxy-D-manno-octulosonate 8-phosphate phosphatase (KDO 8-P phosphatase)
MKAIVERVKRIKMLLLDVDGVMTDGGVILGPGDLELKRFGAQDGVGIALAKVAGLKIGIITGRNTDAVKRRARELKIDVVQQGIFYKEEGYEKILEKFGLKDEEVAYMGDDLLDIPVLQRVGFAVAVANGVEEVKKVSHYVTKKKGGEGAVREVVDLLLDRMGKKEAILASVLKKPKGKRRR